MTLNEMTALLQGELLCGQNSPQREVFTAFAGDMLSDVLALSSQPDILLTGLVNPQVIRTAEMLDTACVVFVRGKEPTPAILELAGVCGIAVVTADADLFEASGILFRAGVEPA